MDQEKALEKVNWSGVFPWITKPMEIFPQQSVLIYASFHGIIYNSNSIPKNKAPKNYEELVDPALSPSWAGKIAIPSYIHWLIRVSPIWGKEKVLSYARKLASLVGGRLRQGEEERIVSGEFPIMLCLIKMITANVFDRWWGVKFVFCQLGGFLPFTMGRFDQQFFFERRAFEQENRPLPEYLQRRVVEYCQAFYVDTHTADASAIRCALDCMAEASKIIHTDKAFVYKVLGKYLRITDTKVLDAAYQSEIPALERRLEISEAALQASLDEIAPLDPRAKSIKPQEMIDRRYLVELEKSGAF